jgi:peptidase A4-like protein
MVPVGENTSHNWSGYAAAGGPFTGVTGTWTVPQPTLTGAPGVGATWVGIGGVTSPDLIQAGTQDTTPGGSQAQFQAWIEMLPAASQQVPLAVAPGDSVTVSIQEQAEGSGNWQITITNNTSQQNYQTTANYTSSESSAEWIEEAPSGRGGILPLDNFNSISFTAASASQGGNGVDLNEAGAKPITMLNATNQPLAVPSSIGSDASSFNVARTSVPATTR